MLSIDWRPGRGPTQTAGHAGKAIKMNGSKGHRPWRSPEAAPLVGVRGETPALARATDSRLAAPGLVC